MNLGRGGRRAGAVGWGACGVPGGFIRTRASLSEGPLQGRAQEAASDSAGNRVPPAAVWRIDYRQQGPQPGEQEAAVVKIQERDDGGWSRGG